MANLGENLKNLGEHASQSAKNAGEKINQQTKVGKEHTEEKIGDTEAKAKSNL